MFEYLVEAIDPNYAGALKVLLTSPGRSMEVVKRTTEKRTVWRHVTLAAGHVHPGTFVAPQKTHGHGSHY